MGGWGGKKKINGICGGPFLSTLSCVPKFVGMALSLIGNIWAAVAACILAEGSEQKGFVQECVGRGAGGAHIEGRLREAKCRNTLRRKKPNCSSFLNGDKSLAPTSPLPSPESTPGY